MVYENISYVNSYPFVKDASLYAHTALCFNERGNNICFVYILIKKPSSAS